MEMQMFTNGGGDADAVYLPRANVLNLYNLPPVGGFYTLLRYPESQIVQQIELEELIRELQVKLCRQMGIPRSAFRLPERNMNLGQITDVLHHIPPIFDDEYSRNNRAKQLAFQRRLDLAVGRAFWMKHQNVMKTVEKVERCRYLFNFTAITTPIIGILAWYFW